MANEGGGTSHPFRSRPTARPFAGAKDDSKSSPVRPLSRTPVRRATLPPFTHLPAALARLSTPKSMSAVAASIVPMELAAPPVTPAAEVTTTQVSVAAALVLDLAAGAPSISDAVTPIWTPIIVTENTTPPEAEEPVAFGAQAVAQTPVAAVVDVLLDVDEPAVVSTVAADTWSAPAAARDLATRSLDVELSSFQLREDERVVPPAPIPGLPAEAPLESDDAPSFSVDSEPESLEADEDDAFSVEMEVVTSEVQAIHMQEAYAEVLERVAARLRAGQIPAAVTDVRSEPAVLAAVLATLLAQRA